MTSNGCVFCSPTTFDLPEPLGDEAIHALRKNWAFVVADSRKFLAFHEAPDSVPRISGTRPREYAWADYEMSEGKPTVNAVKELLRRSLDVACARAGLEWCDDRRVFYFAATDDRNRNVSFQHVDGRLTHVAVTGERQLGWGERASRFRYQLAPLFRAGHDESGEWWVTMRLYVRVTDLNGVRMGDRFHFLDEPLLSFGEGQLAEDPRDGLALFGPSDQRSQLSDHVVIGTSQGIERWGHGSRRSTHQRRVPISHASVPGRPTLDSTLPSVRRGQHRQSRT